MRNKVYTLLVVLFFLSILSACGSGSTYEIELAPVTATATTDVIPTQIPELPQAYWKKFDSNIENFPLASGGILTANFSFDEERGQVVELYITCEQGQIIEQTFQSEDTNTFGSHDYFEDERGLDYLHTYFCREAEVWLEEISLNNFILSVYTRNN